MVIASYILIISVIVSFIVGALVVTRDTRSRMSQFYGLATICFIALSICNYLSLDQYGDQMLFIRLVVLFSTLSTSFVYMFLLSMKRIQAGHKARRVCSVMILMMSSIVAFLDMTPVIFSGHIMSSPPKPIPGIGVLIFIAHFVIMLCMCTREIVGGIRRTDKKIRSQYISVLIGVVPTLLFAPFTNFVLPILFNETQLIIIAPVFVTIFVICVGFAILRYGLFDIKLATIRSFAYLMTLIALVGVYMVIVYALSGLLFGSNFWSQMSLGSNITNIAISLILAIVFQPIKGFFDKITIKLFYKTQYDIDKFAAELGDILTSGADMRHLSRLIVAKIGSTLRSEKAMLCVHQIGYGASYISSPKVRSMKVLSHNIDELDEFFKSQESKILVRGLVPNSAIRELLSKVGIEIVVPLVDNGGTFGYILLGERLSGNYTEHDAKALLAVSDSVTVALQNALSMQKISDINADLENKIDVATRDLKRKNFQLYKLDVAKDEFINIASHQLRTPLTSIKGYASMILDGDAGAINDTQRRFLKEISESSNKMVHIINDFLNVSRIQAGKFILDKTLVQLDKMVRAEVSGFTEMARAADLKIDLEIEDGDYSMEIDEGKLRQVVINMIDNAIYYSTPGTTIYAKLMQKRKKVIFEVMDTGIGVPRAEQKRLFTKFYRATNAQKRRPDGTGVGLYLAKRVIAAHKGGIIFKSKENKGSTFGFYLSVK